MNGLAAPRTSARKALRLAVTTALLAWANGPVRSDTGRSPPLPHAPVLLPGASTLLGIAGFEDAAAALDRSFPDAIEVVLKASAEARGRTPPNCRALLDLEEKISGTRPESDWNVLRQRLADCHALQWLAQASAPSSSALPPDFRAARETRYWPSSIWPAVSRDEIEIQVRTGVTLKDASGRRYWRAASTDAMQLPTLQLDRHDYAIRVQWLARGDFDGDGWEDWLLRWQAQAVGGTWRAARCLLLTRRSAGLKFTIRESGSVH